MKTKKTIESMVAINLNKPKNLNLEDLIRPDLDRLIRVRRDNGGFGIPQKSGKNLRKHIPALYYIVHVLLERLFSEDTKERCWFNKEYVKLYSRDIEPIKSKNDFRYMWSFLNQLEVIKYFDMNEPNKYKKSARAYYFRLEDKYRDSIIVQHEVFVKESIAEKINSKTKPRRIEMKENLNIKNIKPKSVSYHQYMGILNMNFDSLSAKEFVETQLNNKIIGIAEYNALVVPINRIINGKISFSQSDVCKRIFTTVTMMPKTLRQFINDREGNSLTELDFGSFNAFLVYKILNESSPEHSSNVEKIAFENELDLYRRLISGGDFYRDFKEMFFPKEELSREQVKEVVLRRWFNGKLNSRNKYRQHMINRLPRISEVIDSLKEEQYENFSNFMMSRESELVNNIIYRKFIERHPEAIMYTVFDSILIEQKYAAELYTLMLEEGSKYFKINCMVKVKSEISLKEVK